MNIFEKLLCITNEIGTVNKNLLVGEGKSSYKAVGEADVLKAVKELEFKHKVYSYPFSRRILETDTLKTEKTYNGVMTTSEKLFMRIETVYRFVNVEQPDEFIDVTTYGDGVDSQDKAPGKAMTYSDKYALLKAYKMITGDDPDQNPSEENNFKDTNVGKKKEISQKKDNPEIITELEAKSVYALMTRKGLNVVENLKNNFGIENTNQLTKTQYFSIVQAMAKLPDKK